MRHFRLGRKTRVGLTVLAGLAVAWSAAVWSALPAQAATGPVSSAPAYGTPQLTRTGVTEQVRQLVQCGGTMYAVGTFTQINRG